MLGEPSLERARRVELDGVERSRTPPADCDPRRARRYPDGERIGERVRGIGRDDEHAMAAAGFGNRASGGARRFADATLAGVEINTRSELGGGLGVGFF